jgi:predicted glycosyltransferase
VEIETKILWAVSSVGKGHIMRDLAIVNQLRKMADVNIDWLAPDPAGDFLCSRGQKVLEYSDQLPDSGKIFLATIGPEGKHEQRRTIMEEVFENLRLEYPEAYFIITGSKTGTKKWIHYCQFLDNLYQYFAASDFVITQSGYGKVAELAALGTPFIAIPLDHHFEQEYVMRHRLDHYGMGRLITLRDYSPKDIARMAHEMMDKEQPTVEADTGMEVAKLILNLAESSNGDKNAL